jgi:hypothetical protein
MCKRLKLFPNLYFSPASNTIYTIKKNMSIIFSVSLTDNTIFLTFHSLADKALSIWKAIPLKLPLKMLYLRRDWKCPQFIPISWNSAFFFIYQHINTNTINTLNGENTFIVISPYHFISPTKVSKWYM